MEKLVIIHGYQAGGAVYYKLMAHLCQYYEVIAIDLLGQGRSGRPSFGPFSDHE